MATLPAETRIGHVHLKVSDLERSLAFWRDVLGFEVQETWTEPGAPGRGAAFLSAGGYHHHVALNTWMSQGAAPAPARAPGLFHVAILLPDRASLARLVRRVVEARWPLEGAADHGVSEAVYLSDPDGNGVELYADRDRSAWPRDADGNLRMTTQPLDLPSLLATIEEQPSSTGGGFAAP